MAMITDIFAATRSELDDFAQRRAEDFDLDPLEEFKGISIRQITLFEFETLLELLRSKPSRKARQEGLDAATDPEDEEGLILRFPPVVVDRLGVASSQELLDLARDWAKAEGFTTIEWDLRRVTSTLKAIAKLAKHAKATGRDLLMVPGL